MVCWREERGGGVERRFDSVPVHSVCLFPSSEMRCFQYAASRAKYTLGDQCSPSLRFFWRSSKIFWMSSKFFWMSSKIFWMTKMLKDRQYKVIRVVQDFGWHPNFFGGPPKSSLVGVSEYKFYLLYGTFEVLQNLSISFGLIGA